MMHRMLLCTAALFSATVMSAEQRVDLSVREIQDELSGQKEALVMGISEEFVIVFRKAESVPMVYIQPLSDATVFDDLDGRCRWMLDNGEPQTTSCRSDLTTLGYLNPPWMKQLREGESLRLEVHTSNGTDILVMDAAQIRKLFDTL